MAFWKKEQDKIEKNNRDLLEDLEMRLRGKRRTIYKC